MSDSIWIKRYQILAILKEMVYLKLFLLVIKENFIIRNLHFPEINQINYYLELRQKSKQKRL